MSFALSGEVKGGGIADYLERGIAHYFGSSCANSCWFGGVAETFGISDQKVETKAFKNLLSGFSPDGKTPLVQNAGSKDRQSCYPGAFAVPKSVSILHAMASPEKKAAIEREILETTKSVLGEIEADFAWSRRGKGGTILAPCQLLASMHLEMCSREEEPHLHVHVTFVNLGRRRDGTYGAIVSRPLYENVKLFDALFMMELSTRLEKRLGIPIQAQGEKFEVVGVPSALCEALSSRRRQILEAMENRGVSGAVANVLMWDQTRAPKAKNTPVFELQERWSRICLDHGFGPRAAEEILKRCPSVTIAQENEVNDKQVARPRAEPTAQENRSKPDHLTLEEYEATIDQMVAQFWNSRSREEISHLTEEALRDATAVEKYFLEHGVEASVFIRESLLRRFALKKMREGRELSNKSEEILDADDAPEQFPGEELLRCRDLQKLAERVSYSQEQDDITADEVAEEAFDAALEETRKQFGLNPNEVDALRILKGLREMAKGFSQRPPFENPEEWARSQTIAEELEKIRKNPDTSRLFEKDGPAEFLQQTLHSQNPGQENVRGKGHTTYEPPPEAEEDYIDPEFTPASLSQAMRECFQNGWNALPIRAVVTMPFWMSMVAVDAIGKGFYVKDLTDAIRKHCPDSICGIPVHEKRLFPGVRWGPYKDVIVPYVSNPFDLIPRLPPILSFDGPKPIEGSRWEIPGIRVEKMQMMPEVFGHKVSALTPSYYKVTPVLHEQLGSLLKDTVESFADKIEARRAERRERGQEKSSFEDKVREEMHRNPPQPPPQLEQKQRMKR